MQSLVHKILCRQESVMPMPTPTGAAPKTICPPHQKWGGHNKQLYKNPRVPIRSIKIPTFF